MQRESSVLFVDDEEPILEILQDLFRKEVTHIHTASSGAKAIEIAKKHPIQLAVLDLRMPKMDGITVLKELRKIHPNLACMFLSGHGDKASIQAALRLGVEDFIDKPFEDKLLITQVRKALDRVYYESLIKDILELFIFNFTQVDPKKFDLMPTEEKEKALNAALGVARMKLMNKKMGD